MSFRVDGPPANARKVFDKFRMIYRATDLGRIKSVATIPAISTHQQQGEEARRMADVPPQLIRLCVGGEDPADVIADLDQALKARLSSASALIPRYLQSGRGTDPHLRGPRSPPEGTGPDQRLEERRPARHRRLPPDRRRGPASRTSRS